ncbi:MAG: ribosome recycling factor [Clostridium sp.]|jgi:ribosome recycling factor|nr:ribosome recycling factor [Clostridium sp.]
MSREEYKVFEEKMKKTLGVLKNELNTVRAGRANPSILDRIMVNYYGTPTPINQLANVSVPEPRVIVIQPWDSSILKEIEKEIQKSDIGINPNNDGKIIRLVFPVPTEERRKELTKIVKKYGEESKIAIRSIRRDAIEQMKTLKKNSEITEDDLRNAEKDIQNLTDKYIEEIDKTIQLKEKEILEV